MTRECRHLAEVSEELEKTKTELAETKRRQEKVITGLTLQELPGSCCIMPNWSNYLAIIRRQQSPPLLRQQQL